MLDDGFYFYDGTTYRKFAATLKDLRQYTQVPIKADEMVIQIDAGTPAPKFGEVVFVIKGIHIFHGIITKMDDFTNYFLLSCKSMQFLLDYRYIPYNVYHDVDLDTILSSSVPVTVMGVFFLINSYIPNGKWTAYSATVSKLISGGLKSCFRDKALYASTSYPNAGTVDACDGIITLASSGAIPNSSNQYYRDNDDLYIKLADGSYLGNAYIVAALNWCDTRIRLGTIDIGTYKAAADFSLDGQSSRVLDGFVQKLGREVEFLPWNDGTIRYMLAEELPGRSTESSPIRTYRDMEDNAKIIFTNQDVPDVQAAISYSSDVCEASQVISDWNWRGVQLLKGYENNGGSKEDVLRSLQSIIDNNEFSCQVVTTEIDYFLRPGDWIGLYRKDKGSFALRIKEKVISNGIMTLALGKKISSASEIFGSYLRGEVVDDTQPRTVSAIANGTGSFIISAANYALGGLKIFYEESFTEAKTGTDIDNTAFIDLIINGKVAPPGRIRMTGAVNIDITDYCLASASVDTTNTITRILYHGTGWTGSNAYVKQYHSIAFFAP